MSDFFNKSLVVKVLNVADGNDPFICAVNGNASIDALNEIEQKIAKDEHCDAGEGFYVFECHFFEGQYGELGMCEIEPGWEFDMIDHVPDWRSCRKEGQP